MDRCLANLLSFAGKVHDEMAGEIEGLMFATLAG
jgi:hypothetical protein